jgi:hypothetical protein
MGVGIVSDDIPDANVVGDSLGSRIGHHGVKRFKVGVDVSEYI